MSTDDTHRHAALRRALAALAIMAGATGSTVEMANAAPNGVRCEIQVSGRGSSVTLQGIVHANSTIDGSYQMRVSKSGGSGSSDINQSGAFSVAAGGSDTLGSVTLGGDGGSYVARLRVTWSGGSVECTERVRGTL